MLYDKKWDREVKVVDEVKMVDDVGKAMLNMAGVFVVGGCSGPQPSKRMVRGFACHLTG